MAWNNSVGQNKHIYMYIMLGTACLSTLLSLMSLVLIIVTCENLGSEAMAEQVQGPQKLLHEICLPCAHESLLDQGHLLKQLTKKPRDGKEVCCADSTEGLSFLLKMILLEKQQLQPLKLCADKASATSNPCPSRTNPVEKTSLKLVPTSAHKNLLRAEDAVLEEQHTLLQLRPGIQDVLVEHLRNVHVENNALVIMYPGFYYVYMNINFQVRHDLFNGTNNQSMFWYLHHVIRGPLLQASHTVQNENGFTDDQGSVFAGGVFYLNPGDRLQVYSTREVAHYVDEFSSVGLAMVSGGHLKIQMSTQDWKKILKG